MIIWINGAFGAGKTQTAFELHRRIPHSYVYDPENVGYFIRKNIPPEMSKPDFQDHPMWREFNYTMLKNINEQYDGTIIVPMTLVDLQYFDEIVGRLRNDGVIVNHFALCASKETLLKRLKSRGEGQSSWAAQQIDRCRESLSNPIFQHQLDTDHMTTEDVVTHIASVLNINLLPDRRGSFSKKLDKIKTQIKHIRFFN